MEELSVGAGSDMGSEEEAGLQQMIGEGPSQWQGQRRQRPERLVWLELGKVIVCERTLERHIIQMRSWYQVRCVGAWGLGWLRS